jgi:hypothetical protein
MSHIHHGHPQKFVVVEHSIKEGDTIDFYIPILGKVAGYMDCIMKEAWYPVTNMLQQYSETSMKKQGHT